MFLGGLSNKSSEVSQLIFVQQISPALMDLIVSRNQSHFLL